MSRSKIHFRPFILDPFLSPPFYRKKFSYICSMDSLLEQYEVVVGLEVHTQLLTHTKAYSPDAAAYGAPPNTLVHPISLGHPGTLPALNAQVLNYAVKLGLALHCDIRKENHFARKNYFYADLPKGYQITQDKTPICTGGYVQFTLADGTKKSVRLERIHMEEDAGKSMHDQDPVDTLIDLNRAGVPLLEIVSAPDIRSGEEAYAYLTEIRKLVRHLDICDGNMEEGSLRCDANISIRKKGAEAFGTKVEVKNMNSMRHVQKAIEFEARRQAQYLAEGKKVLSETRTFDALQGITIAMRSKEGAQDYRYFPEPDLPPVFLTDSYIQAMAAEMPPLPADLERLYIQDFGLQPADALALIENKFESRYFDALVKGVKQPKSAANWMLGPVRAYLNEQGIDIRKFPLQPEQLAALVQLVENDQVSFTAASQTLFPAYLADASTDPLTLAKTLNIVQESNANALLPLVQETLEKLPEEVARYRDGKKGLLGLFVGEVMKASGGKADPKVVATLVRESLENQA